MSPLALGNSPRAASAPNNKEPFVAHKSQTTKNPVDEAEWESPGLNAKRNGVSRQTIYDKFAAGDIDARKMGARTLVNVASSRAYFGSLPKAQINERKAVVAKAGARA